MKYTGVVILNYNNYEDTFNCIESIEQFNTAPIKFFIVDNASSREGTVETMDNYFKQKFANDYIRVSSNEKNDKVAPLLTFIVSDRNGGYAQGNNYGLKFAYNDPEIEYIMILNNDVLFIEDIILPLIENIGRLPNCGIVSPLLYKKDLKGLDYNCARCSMSFRQAILLNLTMGKPWFGIKKRIDDEQYILKKHPNAITRDFVEIDYPSGSCMIAAKSLWQSIDGFDPNTFLYYEEAILYSKITDIGRYNYLIPSLKCIHLGASSTSQSISPMQTKLSFKSKQYYMLTYFKASWAQKLLLRLTLSIGRFALFLKFDLFQKKNILN